MVPKTLSVVYMMQDHVEPMHLNQRYTTDVNLARKISKSIGVCGSKEQRYSLRKILAVQVVGYLCCD